MVGDRYGSPQWSARVERTISPPVDVKGGPAEDHAMRFELTGWWRLLACAITLAGSFGVTVLLTGNVKLHLFEAQYMRDGVVLGVWESAGGVADRVMDPEKPFYVQKIVNDVVQIEV